MPVNAPGPAELQPGPVGVTVPSGTGVVANEYAKQNLLAKNVRADYEMNAVNSLACDRSFQSEWGRELTEHGDTMTIRRLQMFEAQTGIDWEPQPNLEELVTLHIEEPRGIQTEEEWNTAGVWKSKTYSEASDVAKRQNLSYKIDEEVSRAFARGYMGQITNGRYAGTFDEPTALELLPAGKDSEDGPASHPLGRYPDNKMMSRARAALRNRGIQGRTLVALLDDFTSESLGRTALFTQQYGAGGAGAQAQSKGSVDGQMVGGFKVMDSSLNGVCRFGDNWGDVQVGTGGIGVGSGRDVGGTEDLSLTTVANHEFPEGLRIAFEEVNAVNARTKLPSSGRAQYPHLTAAGASGVTATGTTTTLKVGPEGFGVRVGTLSTAARTTANRANRLAAQTAFRKRNNSFAVTNPAPATGGAPAAGIPATTQVYLNDLDPSISAVRTAVEGKETSRSWLIAQDSTVIIYSLPEVPADAGARVTKMTFPKSKLEYCVGINTLLETHKTLYEVWTRFALGVVEFEAGFQATGAVQS